MFHVFVAGEGLFPVPLVVAALFIIVLFSRTEYLKELFRA
jgi:hypothetical protein